MNSQMRRKASLLSRVSTLAVIAAAGSFGAAQQAQAACTTTFDVPGDGQVVTTNTTCVTVSDPVTGDVVNQALVGDPGTGFIPFEVYADITGKLINNGNIFGGYGNDGALTIRNGATITNGIENNGAITSTTGSGIQIGGGGEGSDPGHILNGITNTNNISSGGGYGIAALYGTLSGGLTNQFDNQASTISGGLAGIYIADTFTSWSGGISNFGQISGVDAAIQMGDGGGGGLTTFDGGIINYGGGVIDSANGTAIAITDDIATFTGGITNSGQIQGARSAIVIQAGSFSGGVTNNLFASIVAQSGDAINANTNNWNGNFDNQGFISATGDGFDFFGGGEGSTFAGNVLNSGTIDADFGGVRIDVQSVEGNISNSGLISAGGEGGTGILIFASTIAGPGGEGRAQITNTGTIQAGFGGVHVFGDTINADFVNTTSDAINNVPPGVIIAQSGAGVILSAETSWQGDITNDGTISGNVGMLVNGFSDGFIFSSDGSYEGTITNTGVMSGDLAGLFITGTSFDGALTNSGQLIGTSTEASSVAGLVVGVNAWTGNITNTSTGVIEGAVTGVYISANTFEGNFVNDGRISGGGGSINQLLFDPGLAIVAGTYTGNITNNGTLDAVTQALFLDIGTLDGVVTNTGTIQATGSEATAVLLEIGNGATFTNTANGLILGDVVFGGKAAYDFVAEQGGIEGQVFGQDDGFGTNDDTLIVQNGEAYFFYDGVAEPGISNFGTITVEDGGTAVMGARFVGDPNGSSEFTFSNVDNVVVNNGGVFYVGQGATLAVDNSYTQDAGGTLMFYLGAPAGISSASGTVVAGSGDYGQLIVDGTATLGNGVIAGFLDSGFGSASSNLDAVEYHDVIIADSISGDFSTLALINSNSIWELDSIIDGNTVDLRVQRTSEIGQIGSLPGIIVEIAGPWKSMVNDRSNGIGSGSCGLAGPGSCFNRFAQATPGAGQVMTDATPGADPFEWLRTGVRRVGETAAWGRIVGVWGETDGDLNASGTDFDTFGGIVGIDHVFTPTLLAGVAAQWTSTDIDFNGLPDNAEVDSFEVGGYLSWGDTRLYLNANTSVIFHDIEVNRFGLGTQAFADYDGTTISAYAEAGKIFETNSGFRIQPLVALSYAHLETDAYSETGTGPLLNVFESDFDSLKSMLGARVAYPIALQSGRKLVPEARLVWAHEFLDDQSSFLATIQGGLPTPNLIVGEEFSRDTIIVGTGITAPLSDETSLFIDYDAALNEDITTHTLSGGFRTRW